MERELLLLGLLRFQDMYGYQLNDLIDSHLGICVQLKKPTIYRLLNKMTDDGWVIYREEQEGNRPPRRVYTITSEGELAFQRLLRESLAEYRPAEFHSDISLAFLNVLPAEEVVPLLHKRRLVIENLLQTAHSREEHHGSFHVMIEHQIHHLSMELEWLDEIVARITAL